MQSAICLLPVVPLRKDPSHRSEMVSQILFGEYVTMEEEKDDFVLVRCLYDGYEGWVQANQVVPVADVLLTTTYVCCAQAEVRIDDCVKAISIGSPVYHPGRQQRFGKTVVQYSMDNNCFLNTADQNAKPPKLLKKMYAPYLYTPYLWGGKSVFGIDCSGFVQQVFKFFGVRLLRDAYLQAGQGVAVNTFAEAKLGDLAFFQNNAGRVMHVGIILENNAIVHASGRVKIDVLDKDGIINNENGKRTHRLHSIRRFQWNHQK